MSTGTEIGSVAITTPAKAMTMDANGKAGFATMENLAKGTPEGRESTVAMTKEVWYVAATSRPTSSLGGSGLLYIHRDWGSGGPAYALFGFCLPHNSLIAHERYKPQKVFAFGWLDGIKVRVVRTAATSGILWRLEIMQPNSTSVNTFVRLPFFRGITPGDLSEAPALDGTEQVYEYSLSELQG